MSMSFAISGPLDRLLSSQTGLSHAVPQTVGIAHPGEAHALATPMAPAPAASLGATLGRLAVERGQDTGSPTATAPAVKPDFYALNRVLNHYAAQSAAADSIVSLVRR